jgi:integrase
VNGKQVIKSMTYKPQPDMSEKQIEKELNKQAVMFEESCKHGQSVTAAKFETFARQWFADYAELKLKRLTLCNYNRMTKRTYAALGHIRIDRITPLDIQGFVRSLNKEGLSAGNVKNHVRFVSVILNYAIKNRVITFNPCVMVTYPEQTDNEREFYSKEEVKQMLTLLQKEKDKRPFAVFFLLAAYTGCRRGELLGLEWKDIDFTNSTISISRAYYYSSYDKTCFTDTPKTKSSRRSLKLPNDVMKELKAFKKWQDKQRDICGGSWVDSDRLFTKWNGEPMRPNATNNFLKAFCKRTGMRKVTIHSFRHFNASALIDDGVDVVAVQTALGHSTAATTLNIYSHAFANAQTRAMEAIANAINL